MLSKDELFHSWYKDMLKFGKDVFPETFRWPYSKSHHRVAALLQNKQLLYKALMCYRHLGKSTYASFLKVMHKAFLKPKNEPRLIIILSEAYKPQALNIISRIKEKIEGNADRQDNFRYYFGNQVGSRWSEQDIICKNGTRIVSLGMGQKIRGFIHGDERPCLIVLDDFESEHNCQTKEMMHKNAKLIQGAVMPMLNRDPNNPGEIICVGTPQHEASYLYGTIKNPHWASLKIPVENEKKELDWPEVITREYLAREEASARRSLTYDVFLREYWLVVNSEENRQLSNFLYYNGYYVSATMSEGILYMKTEDGEHPIAVRIQNGCDFIPGSALGESTGDYATIIPVACDKDDNRYLLKYYRKRPSSLNYVKAMFEWNEEFPALFNLEKENTARVIEPWLIQEMMRRKKPLAYDMIDIPNKSKESKLFGMQPWFEEGKFFVQPGMAQAIAEIKSFPKGKNDDVLDGIYQAMYNLRGPSHSVEELQSLIKPKEKYFDRWKFISGNKTNQWLGM